MFRAALTALLVFFGIQVHAQLADQSADRAPAPTAAAEQNWNFHLQTTVVSQKHGSFPAKYSGNGPVNPYFGPGNSLSNGDDTQTSVTLTIFAGLRLWKNGELYFNPELSGGSGFNGTTGIAGFPNAEIYRVDDPAPKWNLARLFYKQILETGSELTEEIKDDKNQLATRVPIDRLTVIIGKFSLNDYFDDNAYSHDPRTQFLNWALMDQGAWDYAADTRGYSWGFYLEYNRASWALRFASVLVPLYANQMAMDTEYPAASGTNLEYEYRWQPKGAIRIVAWSNRAGMGNYRTAINTQTLGSLDVTQTRSMSRKYGVGLSFDQELANDLGVFSRLSWDDGKTETWAFTEIDQSLSVGLSLRGLRWQRPDDTVGLAYVMNGLSQDHRDYLADGGYGFIIGDGTLNYAPEQIAELYYRYKFAGGLELTGDFQYVQNPAYNSDRGPVSIMAARVHYEM